MESLRNTSEHSRFCYNGMSIQRGGAILKLAGLFLFAAWSITTESQQSLAVHPGSEASSSDDRECGRGKRPIPRISVCGVCTAHGDVRDRVNHHAPI